MDRLDHIETRVDFAFTEGVQHGMHLKIGEISLMAGLTDNPLGTEFRKMNVIQTHDIWYEDKRTTQGGINSTLWSHIFSW